MGMGRRAGSPGPKPGRVFAERAGCTVEQRRSIPKKACIAFSDQKRESKRRGIEWKLTLWEWWTIWQESGKWELRGRCKGNYVMCRIEDLGPYARANVYIATGSHNLKSSNSNKRVVNLAWHGYIS
jgi:hypothetical protein